MNFYSDNGVKKSISVQAIIDGQTNVVKVGGPNVSPFSWTTNDLTSVKDILTYVKTSLEAAEAAQNSAEVAAAMADLVIKTDGDYKAKLQDIDVKYDTIVQLSDEIASGNQASLDRVSEQAQIEVSKLLGVPTGATQLGTTSGSNVQAELDGLHADVSDLDYRISQTVEGGQWDNSVHRFITDSSKEAPRTIKSVLDEIPSIMSFVSTSTTDDNERFLNAIALGHKHVHIPGIEELGRPIIVKDLLITAPLYIYGVGGKNIDAYTSVIQKKAGSSYGIRFQGDVTKRPHGGGISNVVLRGENVGDVGDLVQAQTWSYLQFTGNGFNNQVGWGLTLKDVAESTVNNNLFRRLGSDTTGCIKLDSYLGSPNNNVNNLKINDNTFGLNSGDWISGVALSNTDLVWITGNKFEFDNTPTSPNTSQHSVINLQNASRVFILENGFAHFRLSNNQYADVITLGAACNLRQNISNNEFYGCDGNLWNILGGSVTARGNTSNQADATVASNISVTSNKPQDIVSPSYHSSNSNKNRRSDFESAAWSSSHSMWGTVNNFFVTDANSGSTSLTVMSVPASTEIRRGSIPRSITSDRSFVHLSARVKVTSGIANTISLSIDGVAQGVVTTTADNAWHLYTWKIRPDAITNGLYILTNGSQPVLLDGVFVEKKDYYDWGFSWTPGAVAANSVAASPTQTMSDTTGVFCGQVSATANNSTGGCMVYASVSPNGNVTVYCSNPTGSAITPSFTGVRLRYHLV